jgi:7-cyano-7-deazaguanine synthase
MQKKAIILLSGGIDSAVILATALKNGRQCFTISFDYSQRHRLELRAAQSIARHYNVPYNLIKIDPTAFSKSSLTTQNSVPKNRTTQEIATGSIPSTYVPGRNTLFLAYAMGQAESADADEIYYGPNANDYAAYPDCRPEFVQAFQSVLNVATKQASEGRPPKLIAPLINLTKKDIVKMGQELKVPMELTLTCYDPTSLGHHCGLCDSCVIRRSAFSDLGMTDPAPYKK